VSVQPPQPLSFRTATPANADRLAEGFADGMRVYLTFAPAGWAPRPAAEEAQRLRALLADEREGWEVVGERYHDSAVGLDVDEYRRAL
jgi:hypothetical protein